MIVFHFLSEISSDLLSALLVPEFRDRILYLDILPIITYNILYLIISRNFFKMFDPRLNGELSRTLSPEI